MQRMTGIAICMMALWLKRKAYLLAINPFPRLPHFFRPGTAAGLQDVCWFTDIQVCLHYILALKPGFH